LTSIVEIIFQDAEKRFDFSFALSEGVSQTFEA
jgi:hypothetical protein